jgi:anti-sigma factor RsiW
MDCKGTNKLFAAYLDSEVTESERKSIQVHLAYCSECQKEVEALSATQTKFRQTLKMVTDNVAPSNEAWAELRQQITQEKEAVVARVLPSREPFWERMGRIRLFSRRLTWQAALAGVLTLVVIVSLAVTLPMLTGQDQAVSAAEIALASPEVQAALGGAKPDKIGVAENIDSAGNSRVVMTLLPDMAVIADVNMKTHIVTQVTTQNATDATEQMMVDIAKADPRVQNILNMGYNIYYGGAQEFNISMFQDERALESLRLIGIDNMQDLIGFSGALMLKINSGDYDGYLVWVNVSTGKVVGIADHPFIKYMTVVTKTVINTVITYK